MKSRTSILIIYTGGTIGMVKDQDTGVLHPFDFDNMHKHIPGLELFDFKFDHYSFDPVIDSSNINPSHWAQLAEVIEKSYEKYDGFVVLHGSDTMAYTASALSFMLQNLNKPVILTGSQLPLGTVRSDGRENFITSIEIAAAKEDDTPVVPEVCIYFENQLLRGNRTHKFNAENFEAFRSVNYPPLAEIGVHIKYNYEKIRKPNFKKLKVFTGLDNNIAILKLFPGISRTTVECILNTNGMKAVIMETFGTGNAPDGEWFIKLLTESIDKGLIVLNVTQCKGGSVEMGKYATSLKLIRAGLISGRDITTEAAVGKLMHLLANYSSRDEIIRQLERSLTGEMTV